MKRKFVLSLALLIAGRSYAQFHYLSSSQSANASGFAAIHQYASSNFAFTATSGTIGGNIQLIDPNPDQYGYINQQAVSQARTTLTTGQTASQISFSSTVFGEAGGPYDSTRPGSGTCDASAGFQVVFSVSTPQQFQMSLNNLFHATDVDLTPDWSFTLSSANQGFIGGWGNTLAMNPGQSVFGTLEPGDIYTFQVSMDAGGTSADPTGELAEVHADVTLSLVPEPSTAWLLGTGVVALGAVQARRASKRRA